jgi:hypothetical protein
MSGVIAMKESYAMTRPVIINVCPGDLAHVILLLSAIWFKQMMIALSS